MYFQKQGDNNMAEYLSKTVRDIVTEMINRTTFLPAIQREYEWTTYEIEKLFDSLMCDYPINTFLFWKLREEDKNKWISYEFIRDFDEEKPHNKEANLNGVNNDIYLVLDGQQRMTSLYIGLKGSYRYFYRKWKKEYLYLNLLHPISNTNPEDFTYQFKFKENDSFDKKISKNNKEEQQLWYKVSDILNYEDAEDAKEAIKTKLSGLSEKEQSEACKTIGKLHARIATSKVINFFEVKSDNYDKVMEIFIRTNTGGKKLEYSDLLLSTATAKWKNLNAREEINNFTDEINKIGNGYSFGKDFVMKGAMYLTKDLPIQYKLSSFTKENLELIEENWEKTKNSITQAIKLVSRFGFNDKSLVSKLALLPIAQYLKNKNEKKYLDSTEKIDIQDQNNIQKWLILVTLKNVLGAASDNILTRMRKIIENQNDYFPYQNLLNEFSVNTKFTEEEINLYLSYKYGTKYSFMVLSLMYPNRYWKDRVFHEDHIFPQSLLQKKSLKDKKIDEVKIEKYLQLRDTICNLELLDDSENIEKNAKEFDEWIIKRDKSFKKNHFIPNLNSYSLECFEEFINARRELLIQQLSKFSFE